MLVLTFVHVGGMLIQIKNRGDRFAEINLKTFGIDRFEDFLKIFFFKLKVEKNHKNIAVYVSLPNFKTFESTTKNIEIFAEGPFKRAVTYDRITAEATTPTS